MYLVGKIRVNHERERKVGRRSMGLGPLAYGPAQARVVQPDGIKGVVSEYLAVVKNDAANGLVVSRMARLCFFLVVASNNGS